MYYLCTYNLIVYSNYYRRKGRSSNSCLFSLCAVHFFAETVAYCHLHGSKRSARNRLLAGRRFVMTQKTVYLFKLLVIFLKSAVMFFKKLVMFCQSLADDCCSLLYWLIMHKSALDKNRAKRGGEWCFGKNISMNCICVRNILPIFAA